MFCLTFVLPILCYALLLFDIDFILFYFYSFYYFCFTFDCLFCLTMFLPYLCSPHWLKFCSANFCSAWLLIDQRFILTKLPNLCSIAFLYSLLLLIYSFCSALFCIYLAFVLLTFFPPKFIFLASFFYSWWR